jgi:hypothetical protein
MEGMGVLLFRVWPLHRIGWSCFFIIRDARAIQRFERVFTFSLSFSFSFSLVSFVFFLCILLAVMLAWTLRSGQPSKCPRFRMFAPMFITVQKMGSQDRFSIRSDQTINQSTKEKKTKQPLLSSSTPYIQ